MATAPPNSPKNSQGTKPQAVTSEISSGESVRA